MRYVAKCPNLVLTRTPTRRSVHSGIIVTNAGTRVEFANGVFTTTDKNTIEFLETHRLKGTAFIRAEEGKGESHAG